MAKRLNKVGDLPFHEARAFALLSTFLPKYRDREQGDFNAVVDDADPREIIEAAEALPENEIAEGVRACFKWVLRVAREHVALAQGAQPSSE